MPSAVVFAAKAYSESTLIDLAYSLEQALRRAKMQRVAPSYLQVCRFRRAATAVTVCK
ncbi:hypothetical protein [Robbsia andropogonis]|uniref:hypothetical protein n=1 Tax=Robbsia andropogonis TaxID=28092 RepID=UPI000AF1C90B|nr:hypothetical protein [Robbsia andropogonis]